MRYQNLVILNRYTWHAGCGGKVPPLVEKRVITFVIDRLKLAGQVFSLPASG